MSEDPSHLRGMRRILPAVDPLTRDFWQGGADGELRIGCCDGCGTYVHPPAPVCPSCHGFEVRPRVVSGAGTVYSHTVNRREWFAGFPPPYVIVQVELVEQSGLLVTGNWTGGSEDPPAIGMATVTSFLHVEDVHLPMFGPRLDEIRR